MHKNPFYSSSFTEIEEEESCVNSQWSSHNELNELESFMQQSDNSDDFKIEYLRFESLPEFSASADMMEILKCLQEDLESKDWLVTFQAINSLRSLNKQYPSDTNYLFEAFGCQIQNLLFGLKTCVVKNILLFVKEVFQNSGCSRLETNIAERLVHILIPKTGSVSKIIKSVAEDAIGELIENCLSDETIRAFCLASFTKNKTFNKRAFYFLAVSINSMKESVSAVDPSTLRIIFQCIVFTLQTQCVETKTYAKSILNYFHNLMGDNNFIEYLNFLLSNSAITVSQAELLSKSTQETKSQKRSLASEIRHMRSTDPDMFKSQQGFFVEINRQSYLA
jgi:hypothetical protein